MTIVYKSLEERGRHWQALCAAQAPARDFRIWPTVEPDPDVRYLIAWQPPDDLLERFPNLEVLFSIGAGVDQLDLDRLPPSLPIVRMIDPGLTQGMTEYVSWAVLSLQRDMPAYLRQQQARVWQPRPQRSAATTRVGVMGLGELGRAALDGLQHLGFTCAGWSRSAQSLDGVQTYSGPNELSSFLAATDILVCLLPLTPETRGLLDRALFECLPIGAGIVHVGRGAQLVSDDLLACLNSGHLRAAILDVVDPEPLPADHPLWTHAGIWLTPHIASATQSDSAFMAILENIRRHEAGLPMHGLVDRKRGY